MEIIVLIRLIFIHTSALTSIMTYFYWNLTNPVTNNHYRAVFTSRKLRKGE